MHKHTHPYSSGPSRALFQHIGVSPVILTCREGRELKAPELLTLSDLHFFAVPVGDIYVLFN